MSGRIEAGKPNVGIGMWQESPRPSGVSNAVEGNGQSAIGSAIWHESPHPSSREASALAESQKEAEAPLKLSTKLYFAFPAVSTTSLTILISLYVNDFYVNMGTSLAFLSFFTAFSRSFDVISDPLMGWITDTTTHRFGITGRRKPYMFWGPFFYGTFFTLLFYPPPFYPNEIGGDKEHGTADGWFEYGKNEDGFNEGVASNNRWAGYWFGFTYVLFYLSDTFTNIPYEALGPELHSDPEERSKLFLTQKIFNMGGMIMGTVAPTLIALFVRDRSSATVNVPCSYIFHGNSTVNDMLHGTLPDQLLYVDDDSSGVINKTAEFCRSGEGDFCYEKLFDNGTHYWFETEIKTIEETCTGALPNTPLEVDRYEMSSLAAQQLGFLCTAVVFGLYHLFAMQLLVHKVKERPQPESAPLPLVSSVMRSLNNAAFKPLLGAWALDGLGFAALVTVFPFYVRYVIQPNGLRAEEKGQQMDAMVCMAGFVILLLIMAMISSVGWLFVSRKIGKFGAWQLFNALNAFTNLSFFLIGEGDTYLTLAAGAFNGIPMGGMFLVNTIMSDVIDYDEFLNGTRSEAAFAVFTTLIPKIVAIPASAVPLALINLLGFVQPVGGIAQPQNSSVRAFIKVSFVMLPFSCAVLSFFLKFMYPIKYNQTAVDVREGIKKFEAGEESVYDPIVNAKVKQRSFTEADDKQAVLMEMYTENQLHLYNRKLQEAARARTQSDDESDSPLQSVRLSRIVLQPVIIFAVLTGLLLVATGVSFRLLENQKTSIVPILCCISFGLSLCFLGVSFLRWLSAFELQRYQWHTVLRPTSMRKNQVVSRSVSLESGMPDGAVVSPEVDVLPSAGEGAPLEHHMEVLGRVLQLKQRGAAGGNNATIRETIKKARMAALTTARAASTTAAMASMQFQGIFHRETSPQVSPHPSLQPQAANGHPPSSVGPNNPSL